MRLIASFCFLAVVAFTTTRGQAEYSCDPTPNGLSDNCIGCICEASTRCNTATQCVGGNSFCGPFLISKSFWVDGGKCVVQGDNKQDNQSWRRCATDIVCAANTIRSYINRFGKDCNGDGLVTCDDYTMIHKNGGWNCGNSLAGTDFWNIFQKCKAVVTGQGQNI